MERSALESMSEAVLAIASEREVEPVLRRLVAAARELAGARYAALGIPDGEGTLITMRVPKSQPDHDA